MFSYRHGFHAGNHADVLKHTVLIALLDHLLQKEAALTVIDTHAGAGLYRLDGDFAQTSAEANDGVFRLVGAASLPPALERYFTLVQHFNAQPANLKVYPGSPFITQHLLRAQDKLKLFEMHPSDAKALSGNVDQLQAGRQVAVLREDGFEGPRKFLPPPARRALLLCDPSYELKTDYARVLALVADALKRFATGTYAIWYPLIPRPESHDLPRRLKTLATKAGKPCLNLTLTVKSSKVISAAQAGTDAPRRPGLPASGMFVINPPHTLKSLMTSALPSMVALLGQDRNAAFTAE
ncbi:MAG: hypothetical protein RLZZ401_53 [Pseudomonadota bacterium]